MAVNKDGHEREDGKEEEESFLAYSAEWLQGFGLRVPDESLLQAGVGFYDSLITQAISVDMEEPGRIVCSMRVPPSLCNAGDRLHGGAITSLVDIIGSAAIFSTGKTYSGVSVEINVTFMAAAPLGEEIEIESKALRVGKSLAFVAVDIRLKATGKLVAQGRHTKFLGSSPPNVARSRL
ncbi:hypothetical protein GOP47_0028939 [Adiantum capillus-veneris]|nr:hypothetical protein GOP47_0028939 [Adiantum capillus-veneris]